MTVQAAIQAIRNCNTSEELNELYEAIKLQRHFLNVQSTRALRAGDTVEFTAHGRQVRGTVLKVNRKNVKVKEDGYGIWTVPGSMLRHVVETA